MLKNNIEDICFKLTCYYMATTELYDRSLTDKRSRYDKTEAFICSQAERYLSNKNALLTHKKVTSIAENQFGIPAQVFNEHFKKCTHFKNFSAQGWIDQYNYLCENGEIDFIKERIC